MALQNGLMKLCSVNKDIVLSSFKEVGLPIAVDGSEDNLIHSQLKELLDLYKQNLGLDPNRWRNDNRYVPGAPTDQFLKQIRRRKDSSTFKGKEFVCAHCNKSYANKYCKAAKEHASHCPFKSVETIEWEPKDRCHVLKSAFVDAKSNAL